MKTLKLQRQLWETSVEGSLAKNPSLKLVQFYEDTKIFQSLGTERDLWNDIEIDGLGGNTTGYQTVVDYYSDRDTFTVDRSGGISKLVRNDETALSYDASNNSLTGVGVYSGILAIVSGTGKVLTQAIVDSAIGTHTTVLNGLPRPLHTLVVGTNFTSLSSSLSLQGTGISTLIFPAESPMTTTGIFRMSIDSTLPKTVVLPEWVVKQGPWSL
jgi:hypothetical protein